MPTARFCPFCSSEVPQRFCPGCGMRFRDDGSPFFTPDQLAQALAAGDAGVASLAEASGWTVDQIRSFAADLPAVQAQAAGRLAPAGPGRDTVPPADVRGADGPALQAPACGAPTVGVPSIGGPDVAVPSIKVPGVGAPNLAVPNAGVPGFNPQPFAPGGLAPGAFAGPVVNLVQSGVYKRPSTFSTPAGGLAAVPDEAQKRAARAASR